MTMTCTRCRAAPAPGTASEPRAATRLADPLDPRRRRRAADVVDDQARTTNAYTAETGWLMMAGEWPRRPQGDTTILDDGCWKIDATYKHSTLTYVFELHDPRPEMKTNGRPHDPTGEGGGQHLNWRRPGRSRDGRRSRPIR